MKHQQIIVVHIRNDNVMTT